MSIAVMKQALEVLGIEREWQDGPVPHLDAAIAALRAAIEQAEKQEPVAWMVYGLDGKSVCVTDNPTDFAEPQRALPLYTAPREWVELTDDEARALVNRATFGDKTNWQALVYMVDAKLKEKNT
jgi:hypothetical protein